LNKNSILIFKYRCRINRPDKGRAQVIDEKTVEKKPTPVKGLSGMYSLKPFSESIG